jgi:type IV/VI secretion system ImpK/VasF family protein
MSARLHAKQELQLLNLFESFLMYWQEQSVPIDAYFKKVKSSSEEGSDTEQYKDEVGLTVETNDILKQLQKKLLNFIEQQKMQVSQLASASQSKHYQSLLYAMAALVDELILQQFDWDVKNQWLGLLLELKLFKSRNAGDELIDRMKSFVKTSQSFTHDEKQLAQCYLRVLWLGFDGKYKQLDGESEQVKEINDINRNNLLSLMNNLIDKLEENDVSNEISQLFKENISHNINPVEQSKLAPIKRWKKYILIGVGVYFFAALAIWHLFTYQLGQALEEELSVPPIISSQPSSSTPATGETAL